MARQEPKRMTAQRRAILDALRGTTTHPTADEVYQLVRNRLPRISLGTVYRNLDLLTRCGIIYKLDRVGGQSRYDADRTPHHHIRCTACGRLDDIRDLPVELPLRAAAAKTEYAVAGSHLEFEGVCPHCQAESNAGHGSSAAPRAEIGTCRRHRKENKDHDQQEDAGRNQ